MGEKGIKCSGSNVSQFCILRLRLFGWLRPKQMPNAMQHLSKIIATLSYVLDTEWALWMEIFGYGKEILYFLT